VAFREDAAHGVPGAGSRGTTYEVRIWSVRRFTGRRGSTYRVRWSVAGQETGRTFPTRALADRFRSDLVAATNRGELFDVAEGLPVSMVTRDRETSWWDWAVTYAELRRAMMQWAFIPPRRQAGEPPETLARAVCWLRRNTVKVAVLRDPATARSVLDAIARKLDGSRAAASTIARKRAVFFNALELAVERELLPHNPLRSLRWSAPKTAEAIDPACVVNPDQARALLAAVAQVGPASMSGPVPVGTGWRRSSDASTTAGLG
jgi:hypothetical protein